MQWFKYDRAYRAFFKIWDKLVLHWHHIINPHWFQCTVFCRFLLIAWQRNCDILISNTWGYVIIDVDVRFGTVFSKKDIVMVAYRCKHTRQGQNRQ